ncbi:MAG: HlyD family secretion protein [Blastopirellula sp.]|nr:MAG: HlyD family secretion protein [Blastopirellula sp.]
MNYHHKLTALLSCLLLVFVGFAQAEDAKTDKEAKTVEKKEVKSAALAKAVGTFEAIRAYEISAGTEQVKSLVIKKVVPSGAAVKKGQTLVWFDTKDMDKKVKDAEVSFQLAEIAFLEAELSHQQFLEFQKLDKAKAERAHKLAKIKYNNFIKTDRERQVSSAENSLKSYQASFENALEEYEQLEKMYKEDELTEESEEIVLKRAKRSVESAEYRLEGAKIQTERSIKNTIPDGELSQEDSRIREEMAYDKTVRTLQWASQRKEIEFAKEKVKIEKQREDLKELRADRSKMAIKSPADGFVYYGKFTRGKVSDKPTTAVDATFTNKQVLLTVAQVSPLKIRTDIAEKDLRHVRKGSKATVSPVAFPDRKLTAVVESISAVPGAGNKFDCVLKVQLGKQSSAIMPGMTCNIEFVSETK